MDWTALRRAVGKASITEPTTAVRGVREAVKVEKSRDLVRMVGDLGRVQSKAGTQAALDGLKIAQGPRDVARIARLADVKGSRTRAILKMFGRGALFLAASAFNLAWWILGDVDGAGLRHGAQARHANAPPSDIAIAAAPGAPARSNATRR